MRMLYNQRKKLHKDALFFGYSKKKLSVKSCIKMHYFSATVKRNFKLKAIYLYLLFLISQYENLNSDDYHTSVLKLIYLKHNVHCSIASHCLFKFLT